MAYSLFDDEVVSAARLVVSAGAQHGLTCGTAESCTGGLIAAAITSVSGSSAVLRGGVVSYDPDVKHDVLGVSQAVIDDLSLGVVSEPCALQMCQGAREVLKCDVAVSVTGIAGPGGAEPGKPVGTVWFGIATPLETKAHVMCFAGGRDEVRRNAVLHALGLVREAFVELAKLDFACQGAATN